MSYLCDGDEAKRLARVFNQLWKDVGQSFRIELKQIPFTVKFWLIRDGKDVARFTLVQQVNCCGILVSTDAYVHESLRGIGLGQELVTLKEAIAVEFGYSLIMATVNMTGNPVEVHILEKAGWTLNQSFINKRTKNQVGIFSKILP